MNTKDNRKVVVAHFNLCSTFKIPDGLDLEDKSVVKNYHVKWSSLYIEYIDGKIEEIKSYDEDALLPDEICIEDAEDYGIDYTDEEESDSED